MRVNLKEVFDLIKEIEDKLGIYSVILFFFLLIFSICIFIYLKYSLKSLAEEISKKSIVAFKGAIDKSIQTQIGLFFRDENVRNELMKNIGQKSFDKKIECWQLMYNLYFEYQKSWTFNHKTDIGEYKKIDQKLEEARTKVFTETIHLGYELSQKLIRLGSLMRDGIRTKRIEIMYSGENYQSFNESKLQANLLKQQDIETKISNLMYEVEEWIIKKLQSDQTLDKFEFSREQLEKIKEERDKQFDSLSS
ncbi:hypothetical protein [Flavobacterium microcysteis]